MARPERRFYFRLAMALGMTVRELLERMDSLEIAEWLAFWELEPFGNSWEQTATVCETVAISNGAKGVSKDTFLPVKRRRPAQSEAAMKAELEKIGEFFKKQKKHGEDSG